MCVCVCVCVHVCVCERVCVGISERYFDTCKIIFAHVETETLYSTGRKRKQQIKIPQEST